MFDNISEVDWARAAAFIDGEGNIHISTRNSSYRSKRHSLAITVTNTDPRLVLWFRNNFGGYLITSGKRQKTNHRQAYRWRISGPMAAAVIKGCLPYFLLKREQAEIALDFQSTILGPGSKLTDEAFEKREACKRQISEAKWKPHEWPTESGLIN